MKTSRSNKSTFIQNVQNSQKLPKLIKNNKIPQFPKTQNFPFSQKHFQNSPNFQKFPKHTKLTKLAQKSLARHDVSPPKTSPPFKTLFFGRFQSKSVPKIATCCSRPPDQAQLSSTKFGATSPIEKSEEK
jgi:hypothetical protein